MSSKDLAKEYDNAVDYGSDAQLGDIRDPKAADGMGVQILYISDGGTGIGLDAFRDNKQLSSYRLRTSAMRKFALSLLEACDVAESRHKH